MTSNAILTSHWALTLAALLLVAGSAAQGSVVLYLPFDGSMEPQVGDEVPWEVHDGPAEFQPGRRGEALYAGDGQAYLSLDAGILPAREGTLEFWLKPLNWDAISTNTFHIFAETDSDEAGNRFLLYKYYTAQQAAFIWEADNRIFWRQMGGWRDWVHLAVTWSPEGYRLYFNGEASPVAMPKAPPEEYVGRLRIGDRAWQPGRDEHTLIDELYIYDRALEPEEIQWAMENVATRSAGAEVPAGLVPSRVRARILPSAGEIIAELRPRLSEEALAGLTGTLELLGPTSLEPVHFHAQEREVVLPFSGLAEGDYRLRVQFTDAEGVVVDEAEDAFSAPSNEWLGNTIGISDIPPPPYTPLAAAPTSFTCWGREYRLASSGLPEQITSGGEELLAGPVALVAEVAGEVVDWQFTAPQLLEASAVAAEYAGQATSPLGTLEWTALAEYDGMVKYTLTLTPPAGGATLDGLELRFPLRAELATLHNCKLSRGSAVGAVPEGSGAVLEAAGAYHWWLGDEERGLLAFCESDEAWGRVDRPDGFRLERGADAVEAVWRFLDGHYRLDQPWTFTFGLTATPVKPTTGTRGRPSRVMPMNPWLMPDRPSFTPAGLTAQIENETLRDRLGSELLLMWLGGEWQTYTPDWGFPEVYAEGMAKLRAQGFRPLTYMLPREIPVTHPKWRFWGAEWAGNRPHGWTNDMWDSTTCTSSWADFVVWLRIGHLRRYNLSGLYIDNGTPAPVRNLEVGAGYVRDGEWRPSVPYFGLREVFKRLYTAVKQYEQETGEPILMVTHMSGEWPVAHLGFMDLRLDGEQFLHPIRHQGRAYHGLRSLDQWRAQFLPGNVGSAASLLAYQYQPADGQDGPGIRDPRELLSLLLLHDVGFWASYSSHPDFDPIYEMWEIQDEFGVSEAELWPYWSNQDLIRGQSEAVKVTAYRKPQGGTLLVVANLTEEAQTARLSADWEQLQSPGSLLVRDAETRHEIAVSDDEVELTIAPLDYRMLEVQ